MIDGLKVLALITARGGSKGLPGKNVRPLAGKPLVAWSVEAAKGSRHVDRVVISSDDAEIIAAAVAAGCDAPFVRPAELAQDSTASEPVAIHALDALAEPYDLLVLLQPTSPLRIAADIDLCLERCVASGAPGVISVVEPAKSPYWMFRMDAAGRLSRLLESTATRRQDLPQAFAANGAVFVVRVPWFRRHRAFIGEGTVGCAMPPERSVDIDTLLDFRLAEAILAGAGGG